MGTLAALSIYRLANLQFRFNPFGCLIAWEGEGTAVALIESAMHSASSALAWLLFCDRVGQAATVDSIADGHRCHKA